MFTSSLLIEGAGKLCESIFPEQKDLESKRAKVTFDLSDSTLEIKISAEDFSSFRAMESAVMRLLVTYYKATNLEN